MILPTGNNRHSRSTWVAWIVSLLLANASAAGVPSLAQRFQHPPPEMKPWSYYFFESQMMERPGITADLEALAAVGVGGLIVFAEHREGMKTGNVPMFSPEYDAGMRHLLREAERLGLTVSLFNCAGSATAGGPWNTVEQSMKQFVWSETTIAGGRRQTTKLKQPATVAGFYRDIATMAYPVTPARRLAVSPKVSAPRADGPTTPMTDGNILTSTLFRGASDKDKREIVLEYDAPVNVGRLAVHGNLFHYTHPLEYELEVWEDGGTWKSIARATQLGNNPVVADFPPVTARRFRVWVTTRMENFWIAELDLLPTGGRPRSYPQFNDWGAATGREKGKFHAFQSGRLDGDQALDPATAVDLTAQVQPDGTLTWDFPAGTWLVLRQGYTTTGKKNHPARNEGLGYEVDKFDPQLVRRHAEEGLRRMSGGAPEAASLKIFHADSWEAGGQTWTENLPAEFERRNGYALRPFLPVLGARLVADGETTRRFLEDFRRTLQALVAEAYYGTMGEVARRHGLQFMAESSAGFIPINRPLDFFDRVDIPAGEAWSAGDFSPDGDLFGGLRDAISAAHLLGRPMTPVEVFTSPKGNWNMSPRFLKPFGDKILATGANQLTLHAYIHQPTDNLPPGWTMNHFGTTFNRHVTWWKQAGPWLQSVARSQLMLRQGRTVADFCRLIGDDESVVASDDRGTFWDAPPGYANDWISGNSLLRLVRVEQGTFVASGGAARYRLLVLPASDRMRLEVAQRLHELVEAGGVILGARPRARAGLQGGAAADREFDQLIAALWGDETSARSIRSVGRGRVLSGMSVDEALATLKVAPDMKWMTADESPKVHWHHRGDAERDIYFVANGNDRALRATLSFRIEGRAPEIWQPETGEIRRPAVFRQADQRVELPIELTAYESTFVVFDRSPVGGHFENVTRDGQSLWPRGQSPAEKFPAVWMHGDGRTVVESAQPGEYAFERTEQAPRRLTIAPRAAPIELRGPWSVRFVGANAPPSQVFDRLIPWNEHTDSLVRYFSGAGEYRHEFGFDAATVDGDTSVWLDLGELRELAEVALNGEPLGVFWRPPFRMDVTGRLRSGRNEIFVRVINTWTNRLIGDLTLPEAERQTWTSFPHYQQTDPLPVSGLLGPVTVSLAAKRFVPTR